MPCALIILVIAFAEYQTEITDLTHDVEQMVSPYLDFPQYAMRVLYPGLTTHTILEPNVSKQLNFLFYYSHLLSLLLSQYNSNIYNSKPP